MDGELQNANPTVLTTAELPSRRRNKTAKRGPEYRFDDVLSMKHVPEAWRPPKGLSPWPVGDDDDDEFTEEPIDEQEIYDLISNITDPEHPLSLGQLSVVNLPDIHIKPAPSAAGARDPGGITQVLVDITPTVNHCSLATVLGLAVKVRLDNTLPPNYRVDVRLKEGTHASDEGVTKQLSDKERVAAALENDTLRGVVDTMLQGCKQPAAV